MFVWNLFTSFCFVNNMMAWEVWSSQVFCWHFLFNTNLHKLGYVIDNTCTYNNAKRGNNGHYILLKILWEKNQKSRSLFFCTQSITTPPPKYIYWWACFLTKFTFYDGPKGRRGHQGCLFITQMKGDILSCWLGECWSGPSNCHQYLALTRTYWRPSVYINTKTTKKVLLCMSTKIIANDKCWVFLMAVHEGMRCI